MYAIKGFTATDDADWAETIELIDGTTNSALDASDLEFELQVKDCDNVVLQASTADNSITRPSDSEIAWRFPKAQMGGLCPGTTYKVGCVYIDESGNTEQLFVGSLALIDGGMV
jgi:hypothetical protein